MLTSNMERIIRENTIGLIATITPDGFPAVSPKATTVILDKTHIAFCDIRSPQTRRNIKTNPFVEANYIDVFRRQACRLRGVATYLQRNSTEFETIRPQFETWGELLNDVKGIFQVEITAAQHIFSPAYDRGADESSLKAEWLSRYTKLIG
ncbi:MAG: pyridoxamine 5'-phosphate oxidase [Rhodospirillaceae bacterium]|nr:pyridoxamine 5'-phosphate oxidase [Rhodospirillaceae bacterium]|tara:strand:- start:3639 stop:4091 length:453 start_codon:yes stop_codon:yes gene_type:complete